MKKFTLPVLVLSLGLVACGGSDNAAELAALEAELNNAVEEMATEPVEEEVTASELFSSVDGKFEINFPGTPTENSDIIPTEVGNIEMTSFLYEKSVTEAYMVAYSDYPSEMVKQSSINDILVGARDGSSGNLGITSFDLDEKIEIDGNPGMYFKGTAKNIYAEYKLYMVENRLYQVAILRDGSYATPKRSDEFFNSFALISEE